VAARSPPGKSTATSRMVTGVHAGRIRFAHLHLRRWSAEVLARCILVRKTLNLWLVQAGLTAS
jgi:hypothetical protein